MSSAAAIVPDGIHCILSDFQYTKDKVEITVLPVKKLFYLINPPFVAVCMIYLNSPASNRNGRKVLDNDVYITLEQEFNDLSFSIGKPSVIKFREYKNEFGIIDKYRRVRIFFSLIFNSNNGDRLWTKSPSYLLKGAELDLEHENLIKMNKEETTRKRNAPSEPYFKLSRR